MTKPDWRDPDMPVLLQTTNGIVEVSPEQATEIFAERMRKLEIMQYEIPLLNWRDDPTYNLRRSKP